MNGEYCCAGDTLLNGVLKDTWGYAGWVMSDWGAVHDWSDALNGLDQECGAQLDVRRNGEEWFGRPLEEAFAAGRLPKERLSDMVRRILYGIFAVGADRPATETTVDMAQHNACALDIARQGIVLLKNDGALPLAADTRSIAIIGGQAQLGVPAGGGSSLVTPPGGFAATIPIGGDTPLATIRRMVVVRSSPLRELRKLLPEASIIYDPGIYPADAAALARRSEVAIVFATTSDCEGFDSPDLSLPSGQDALIASVAAANPNTIVMLETGNPAPMPWHDSVRAIVAAWYSGQAGGQAIAEVITGAVNPSGRLPITFPADIAQTPRPELPGFGRPHGSAVTVRYDEGAEVGYRWFAKTGATPLYAFGHGLSYTTFEYGDLSVEGGDTVSATFTVTNTGERAGADVPQLYLTAAPDEERMRLLGFERVELQPGESRRVTVTADPRLLARFDAGAGRWRIAAGIHRLALGRSAGDLALTAETPLTGRLFGR